MLKMTPDSVVLPSVFTEMIRSFVVLGETQNLSASVDILNVSRQTIRRHINALEALKGTRLFETNDRQYRLTPDGEAALEGAKQLIKSSTAWLTDSPAMTDGLLSTAVEINDDAWLYGQRHRLNDIWNMAPPILRTGLKAWFESCGMLDHEAMDTIRPYICIFRKYRGEWLLIEFGEKSAYGTWLGSPIAKAELGRKLDLGSKNNQIVDTLHNPYQEVSQTGGTWYEHIAYCMPRYKGGEPIPVQYQRLVLAGKFADLSPAVIVVSARTDVSEIPGRPAYRHIANLPENLMDGEVPGS